MIAADAQPIAPHQRNGSSTPTVWGLEPVQLHDRFWAHCGVQVVRPGESVELSDRAQLYLLTDEDVLATFESTRQIETLFWSSPDLVYVRIRDTRERGYRERVITDSADRFVRFERVYGKAMPRLMRAAFTPDQKIAAAWQAKGHATDSDDSGWRMLRAMVPRKRRSSMIASGTTYDRSADVDLARLVKDLTRLWTGIGAMIPRAKPVGADAWVDESVKVEPGSRFVGPVWVGAGRTLEPQQTVIGPAVLWDEIAARPATPPIIWPAVRHAELPHIHKPIDSITQNARVIHSFFKRAFDIVFSVVAILLSLPLYPFIMLAIFIEDGWPVFFGHKRETIGSREFPCMKFRSMYRDAEKMKQQLAQQNQADGPQFFMEKDVRVTKVGHFLRRTRLDELPQFFNVLVGHMSVVGPRPSPFKENQFCPAWREARLSVKPGITGLWQVKRTRTKGEDFQEWIKYDIEYVENASFSLDMLIVVRTALSMIAGLLPFGGKRKAKPAAKA